MASFTELPLTPFEHYLYAQDTIMYPMSSFVKIQCEGLFHREKFLVALRYTLQSHPLFASLIKGKSQEKTRKLAWIFQPDSLPFLSWEKESCEIFFAQQGFLDLSKEIGLRIWIRENKNQSTLLLQNHHAVSDGFGILQFLKTLLLTYDQQFCFPKKSLPKITIDTVSLQQRNVFRMSVKKHWLQFFYSMNTIFKFIKNEPVSLIHFLKKKEITDSFILPEYLSFSFEKKFLTQLLQQAKEMQVTLNDIFITALFNALKNWIMRVEQGNHLLRIAVPFDLRKEKTLLATNIVTLGFISRKIAEINSDNSFLLNISQEMQRKKRWQLPMMFLKIIQLLGHFSGGLKKFLDKGVCRSSVVFSNLGCIFTDNDLKKDAAGCCISGNVKLTDLTLLGPITAKTPVNFTASTYAGILTVTLYYDGRLFEREEAGSLFQFLVSGISKY